MSLNNRISIRKNCEARGAVVDCEVELGPRSGAHPRPTTDIIILEPEKSQNDRVKEWIAEAGVEERVNCETCHCYVIYLFSHTSSSSPDHRHCVMLIIRTGCVIYRLRRDRLFQTAVINLFFVRSPFGAPQLKDLVRYRTLRTTSDIIFNTHRLYMPLMSFLREDVLFIYQWQSLYSS